LPIFSPTKMFEFPFFPLIDIFRTVHLFFYGNIRVRNSFCKPVET
jgi:hypothetical protein